MTFAFFFPGQGSQSPNMMAEFADMAIVRSTFDEASSVLNQDLWHMLQDNDSTALNETINTQPLMLTAGVATWRVYQSLGGKQPTALAGHSLGEYSALVAADSLDFADAVALTRLRAQLMQNAVPQGQGAMAAILGLNDEIVRHVCHQAEQNSDHEVVEAVNFNAPGQVVIAGNIQSVTKACDMAKESGAKRAIILPVSVPSHCRLMKSAATKLAKALDNITIHRPSIHVIHNVDVAIHDQPDEIKTALVHQLYSPVRWVETVNRLLDERITQFAECGPGKVLTGLSKRINKTAQCVALLNPESIKQFISDHNIV